MILHFAREKSLEGERSVSGVFVWQSENLSPWILAWQINKLGYNPRMIQNLTGNEPAGEGLMVAIINNYLKLTFYSAFG